MVEDPATNEPARRPGGRTARLRERMLEAAVELVAQHGLGGLRYEEVAERAGVNKTSVYRNWPERDALISDALISFATDVAPLHDTGDIDTDLVDFLEALAASLATPRGQALLNVVTAARESTELRAVADDIFERRQAALRHLVDAAVRRGALPPIDSYFLGEMLSGPVHLFVSRRTATFTRADAQRISRVILAGIRALHDQHPESPAHAQR